MTSSLEQGDFGGLGSWLVKEHKLYLLRLTSPFLLSFLMGGDGSPTQEIWGLCSRALPGNTRDCFLWVPGPWLPAVYLWSEVR